MPDLLDTSVWLVLSLPGHPHHRAALRYWREEADAEIAFTRVTMLGLLRLLTHPEVTGGRPLSGRAAWEVYQAWLRLPGVALHPEPPGLDRYLAEWADGLGRGHWTDADLTEFALAGGYRLVGFDGDTAG